MQCPQNEKNSINIINNVLIFQILLLSEKSFSIEVRVTDNSDSKRRLNFSTSFKEIETHEFHIQMPLKLLIANVWTNLYINIGDLLSQSFANKIIKCIDYISISGSCKVRKIYAIKNINDPINKGILLFKNTLIRNMKIDNIISGIEDYNIIVPNTSNVNINLGELGNNLNQDNNGHPNIKGNKNMNKTNQVNKQVNKKSENTNNINNQKNDLNNNNNNKTNTRLADTLKKKTKENTKVGKAIKDTQFNTKAKNKNNNSNNNSKITEENTKNISKTQTSKSNNEDNKKNNIIKNENEIKEKEKEKKFNKFGLFDASNLLKPPTLNESIEEIDELNANPLTEENTKNITKPQINKSNNEDNKKDNIIKNENEIKKKEKKFNKFGLFDASNLLKPSTLNESIEEIDELNVNPLVESIMLKAPEINTVTNIKNEDIIHIDKQNYNSILNTQLVLNEISNQQKNVNNEDLRGNFNNDNNRPYSPPIGKMIPVSINNDNKNIDINKMNFIDRDLNPLTSSLASVASVSTKLNHKAIQNYDNLIYDEKVGKYYDPITKIYYDIKNKENK